MESQRYIFKYYYIGRKHFFGSQRQKNIPTIEDCLIKALEKRNYIINFKDSSFEVASRTDRFVSARGATFSFITNKKPILIEINVALPKEIGIWAFSKAPTSFSSRYNAICRHYKYIVPQSLKYLQKKYEINLDIMENACKELEGIHDFANFFKKENNEKQTKRRLDLAEMSVQKNRLIFDFKSKSFLRQQIRRMVKKILELGKGEINYDDFLNLLNPKNYYSYQPADPSGLILWDIIYDNSIQFQVDLKSKERMENYFLHQKRKYQQKYELFNILQHSDFS